MTISQHTQTICITFVQRRPNIFDVGPTLYKCYTNASCLLGCHYKELYFTHVAFESYLTFKPLKVNMVRILFSLSMSQSQYLISCFRHVGQYKLFRWIIVLLGIWAFRFLYRLMLSHATLSSWHSFFTRSSYYYKFMSYVIRHVYCFMYKS